MAEQSLKDKTVKGVGWSAADAFLGHSATFLIGLLLARLLSPAEYGLIGIVLIFTTVLSGIVDSGFSTALIRKKDTTDADYNTMFITNMAISLLIYGLLWLCAPTISHFFDRPELVSLTRVTGLILIFQALSITQVTILTKRIDFKTKTKASLIASIASGMVGVGMAFMGFGVWALVGQKLSNTLLYSVCLWILNRWWPNFSYSKRSLSYMWGFGWKMTVSGLLEHIWNQLYQVVVGKFYSPATLGQYSRAHQYASIFSININSIVGRVSYPVLAEIQDDRDRLISGYRKIIKVTMFVTAICMIPLGAIADPLFYCLIGPQWHQAATFLPFICISLSLYPLHAINLNMLKVQGRSDLFLKLEIIKKFIAIGPLCLGVFVDIYWMVLGSTVVGIISFFLNSYYSGKLLNYTSLMQLKDIAPSYFLAFLIAFSAYFFKYLPLTYWFVLPIQLIICVCVFFLYCNLTKMEEYKEVKKLVSSIVNKIKILKK